MKSSIALCPLLLYLHWLNHNVLIMHNWGHFKLLCYIQKWWYSPIHNKFTCDLLHWIFFTWYQFPHKLHPAPHRLSVFQHLLHVILPLIFCTAWWRSNSLYNLAKFFANFNTPPYLYRRNIKMIHTLQMTLILTFIQIYATLCLLQSSNRYQNWKFSAFPWLFFF